MKLITLIILVTLSTGVFAKDTITSVHFKRGESSTSYHASLLRGDTATYSIGAKKNQILTVKINSLEDNSNFSVKKSHSKSVPADSSWTEASSFQQKLPENGSYDIVVENSRGNSAYNLDIDVE